MKLSTRLKYVFAALIMGAIVVFDHLWAGWLPNDYPYATWIHYGLLAPVGFCLAVSLRYDMRGSSYTPARRTAGDEHGDCAEPFRTPRGWGIHTMVVRTEVNGANHDRY